MRDFMMENENSGNDMMETRVVQVLETRPEVEIPNGFATRVMRQLPAKRPVSLTPTHYGHHAMVVSLVVLLVAVLAWAPRAAGHSAIWVTLEWILCAQFASLAWWLAARKQSRR